MTIPPMICWAAAAITLLAAAMPITRERLTRFATLTDLTPTEGNARYVIDHFAALRRWRLITVAAGALPAVLTNDPFYLVVGWSAVSVFQVVRLPRAIPGLPQAPGIYRRVWLLSLIVAATISGFILLNKGVTPARLAHVAVVVVVAAAVQLTQKLDAGPAESDDLAPAEQSIRWWSARGLYLGGTAIVLAGAFVTPGQQAERKLPEYATPRSLTAQPAEFDTVKRYKKPVCPWFDQVDDPCRSWLVNKRPFPQAAPYVIDKGGRPQLAPFVRSHDRKAVVYLGRYDRRMTYQADGVVHSLTGSLTDAAVPAPTFAGQSRYVALAKDGVQVFDTRTWDTISVPGALRVRDLAAGGFVVSTASEVVVLDLHGKKRMSLPLRKPKKDVVEDAYFLRPDGKRLVVMRSDSSVETFDTRTGQRLFSVSPTLPGDDWVDSGPGWTEHGSFLVHAYDSERVYVLDLATGDLRKRPQ